jgi:hypothetical protein
MSVDFLNNSLHKILSIGLSERLLKVHGVTHHFCMERDRVLHPLLKLKVRVMEEVFIGFFESGLVRHVVETLSDRFRHSL